ncbi:MAG: glucose-1-phosphate cytidylyltransferase [Pseudomonadota bacterium]
MKAVILAGGLGTRISEETQLRPKPMIEIGDRPILWHLMKIYAAHGVTDFVICLGYRGYVVKEYFANYYLHQSDVTFDLAHNQMEIHHNQSESWRVTLVDTGQETMTGGRLRRVGRFLDDDEPFFFTYGDGLADIDLPALLAQHRKEGRRATITAVRPPGRFGALSINDKRVVRFEEKPAGDGAWVNGGFFVLEKSVLKHIHGDETVWEIEPMEQLAAEGQLSAYVHDGFWQPLDTLRDKRCLEELWSSGRAPWKIWK